jgi:hypothetical protein
MPSEVPVHALDKFVLRLPDGMREKIGQAARLNKRTMNAEIVSRLEQSFTETAKAFLVVNENTAQEEILLELPGALKEIRDELAALNAALVTRGKPPPTSAVGDSAAEPPLNETVPAKRRSARLIPRVAAPKANE